ncbi:MAG: hypothetical protein K0S32_704 [Bacteroidetes bacterium]|nr:hypothetical protein [Bacteroidota bacterium]
MPAPSLAHSSNFYQFLKTSILKFPGDNLIRNLNFDLDTSRLTDFVTDLWILTR